MADPNDRLRKEIAKNEAAIRARQEQVRRTSTPAPQPTGLPPELLATANELGISPDLLAGLQGQQSDPYPNLPIGAGEAGLSVTRPVLGAGGLGPANEQTTVGEWMTDFTRLGQRRISTYQDMMVRGGWLTEGKFTPGVADPKTLGSLADILVTASNAGMSPENVLALGIRNQETLATRRGGGGGGGGGARRPTLQLQLSNRDELRELLDTAATQLVGRNLESLGINPDEYADAVQSAEREFQTRAFNMQVNNQAGELEQLESASARARRFLEERAAPQIEARQMASAMSVFEQLVRGG